MLILLVLLLADKDTDSVDNDWFLCPVKILDHEGPLVTNFPVENRLVPQVQQQWWARQQQQQWWARQQQQQQWWARQQQQQWRARQQRQQLAPQLVGSVSINNNQQLQQPL
jgi:2-succinyl-5-enolpyruvyl-6-hydroxy-3-cyclohexene-1-carboxylate synthase